MTMMGTQASLERRYFHHNHGLLHDCVKSPFAIPCISRRRINCRARSERTVDNVSFYAPSLVAGKGIGAEDCNTGRSGLFGIIAADSAQPASTTGGDDPGGSFNFDFVQGMKNLTNRGETLEEEVAPTPIFPAEGPNVMEFVFYSILLLFVFWLGNYVVPNLVFKDTVFKETPEDEDEENMKSQPIDRTTGDEGKEASGQTPANEESKGFGKSRLKLPKGARKK